MITPEIWEKLVREVEKAKEIANRRWNRYAEATDQYTDMYMSDLSLDTLYFEGDEYWSHGGHEHHHGSMPAEVLYMTDENFEEFCKVESGLTKARKLKEEEQRKLREVEALKAQHANLAKRIAEKENETSKSQ